MRHALTIFAALLLLVLPARAEVTVDLELVLAVDVSLSMDIEEQELQRQGFIAAFRDASVQQHVAVSVADAVASLRRGKISKAAKQIFTRENAASINSVLETSFWLARV